MLAIPPGPTPILILSFLLGLLIVAVVLYDVYETVVLPRRTDSRWRLAPPIIFALWPIWHRVGLRIRQGWRREDFLGTFAPSVLMIILVVWVATLILGFGLIFYALQDDLDPPPRDFPTAVYAAGTALLTIGYGDIVPTSTLGRVMALAAAASGLAVLALVISLIFNLYNSFSRREILVLLLDPRAGAPPSGLALLETFGQRQITGELGPLFYQYELWTAEVLDSHLAYPVLPYFRSSHDNQSWISALGAVLDAATLLRSAVAADPTGSPDLLRSRAAAEMMYHTGCHAITDLAQSRIIPFHLAASDSPGIERTEFEEACRRLTAAGYRAECSDAAWQHFSELRAVYAEKLNRIARYLSAPPTRWIGDRSAIHDHGGFFSGPNG